MRENRSFTQAQSVQDQLQNRGMGFLQGASNLDQMALANLDRGGSFGGRASAGGAAGAKFPWQAAQSSAGAVANFFSNLGQSDFSGLKGLFGGDKQADT